MQSNKAVCVGYLYTNPSEVENLLANSKNLKLCQTWWSFGLWSVGFSAL